MATILFYSTRDENGFLSNFSRYPIVVNGVSWITVEHFYQASKFDDPAWRHSIHQARSPSKAAKIGRSPAAQPFVRDDWSEARELVMLQGLRAKFEQHPDLARLLVSTGDALLIEHTPLDSYWADGGDGTGKNRLGILLQQVREEQRVRASGRVDHVS